MFRNSGMHVDLVRYLRRPPAEKGKRRDGGGDCAPAAKHARQGGGDCAPAAKRARLDGGGGGDLLPAVKRARLEDGCFRGGV